MVASDRRDTLGWRTGSCGTHEFSRGLGAQTIRAPFWPSLCSPMRHRLGEWLEGNPPMSIHRTLTARGAMLLAVAALVAGCDEAASTDDEAASTHDEAAATDGGVEAEVAVRKIGASASFRGINGIHFGPNGDLWLASVVTPAVARIDPESGEILENLGLGDGPKSPDDLAFGPDGSVYWTDISNGEVAMRSPDGHTKIVAAPGAGVKSDHVLRRWPLVRLPMLHGHPALRARPARRRGTAPDPRRPRAGLRPERDGLGFGGRAALRTALVPRRRSPASMWTAAELETVADGFGVPAAVKFDSQGRLHVLDALRGEVIRLGEDGGRAVVARVQPGLDNFAFKRGKTDSSYRASPTVSSSKPCPRTRTARCWRVA